MGAGKARALGGRLGAGKARVSVMEAGTNLGRDDGAAALSRLLRVPTNADGREARGAAEEPGRSQGRGDVEKREET